LRDLLALPLDFECPWIIFIQSEDVG
jgi:hypothetical protein